MPPSVSGGLHSYARTVPQRVATSWTAVGAGIALIAIGTADIIFAVDSIPAIFAVTQDPFLVFTSNAFAILGLRAMYFLLADLIDRFIYLKAGLAAILQNITGSTWPGAP